MGQTDIDRAEPAAHLDEPRTLKDGPTRFRERARHGVRGTRPSARGPAKRLAYNGRVVFAMFVLAVIVDLAVFEVASRWPPLDNLESSGSRSTASGEAVS